MTIPRSEEELNNIWKNIINGKYKEAVDTLSQEYPVIVGPERLFSDEAGDAMSIPNPPDGRDLWRRKLPSEPWHSF